MWAYTHAEMVLKKEILALAGAVEDLDWDCALLLRGVTRVQWRLSAGGRALYVSRVEADPRCRRGRHFGEGAAGGGGVVRVAYASASRCSCGILAPAWGS